MMIRTLIVDDEPLARERLRTLLEGEPDIQLLAECGDGRSAADTLKHEDVNLVFLDIRLPEMDAFELLSSVPPDRVPEIIFVTGYDCYALQAFEVHAVDYLLKPVDPERMRRALNQVRSRRQLKLLDADLQRRIAKMLDELDSRRNNRDRIVVKSDKEFIFLQPEEIEWVESSANYVCLHVGGATRILRETLWSVETRLAPYNFVRISRSVLVNTARIRTLRPALYGDYEVELRDGTKLTLSRGYRESFFNLTGRL